MGAACAGGVDAHSTQRGPGLVTLLLLIASVAGHAETLNLSDATIEEVNAAIDAGALSAERLVELSLARIAAYDDAGPAINAVMLLNPNALERARDLDVERETRGRRSPLHGIPVVLKDNIDTADMPTTAGSFMLKDSLPPDDAFLARRYRGTEGTRGVLRLGRAFRFLVQRVAR